MSYKVTKLVFRVCFQFTTKCVEVIAVQVHFFGGEDIAVSRTMREVAPCQEAGVLKVAIVSIDVLAAERR